MKKEADYSRWVGGRFNKQEDTLRRLIMGDHKMSRSLHSPSRTFLVDIASLMGFHYVYHPDSVNNTLLSQSCVLEVAPSTGDRTHILRIGRG